MINNSNIGRAQGISNQSSRPATWERSYADTSMSAPTAPPVTPLQSDLTDSSLMSQQGPPVVSDRYYIPGYLSSIIGKTIRGEFLIGNNQYLDKTGKLVEVGVNYFVLEESVSRARVMCDLYSVKFVTTL